MMDCHNGDETVDCMQCGWPIRTGHGWACVYDTCSTCQQYHIVGVVHTGICTMDLASDEPRVKTQKRIAGMSGLN